MLTVSSVGTLLNHLKAAKDNDMQLPINKILMLILCFPLQSMAQEYSEQSLKTLFTSQQQRQDIELGRRSHGSTNGETITRPSSVEINGLVKRSDGKNVVWINGKNTMDSSVIDGTKIYSKSINDQNKVPVMIDGRKVYVKPGQSWSEISGVSGVGE